MKKINSMFVVILAIGVLAFQTYGFAALPIPSQATSHMPEKAVEHTADVETGKPADAGAKGQAVAAQAKSLADMDKPVNEAAQGLGK